jgi:hypothetical protein
MSPEALAAFFSEVVLRTGYDSESISGGTAVDGFQNVNNSFTVFTRKHRNYNGCQARLIYAGGFLIFKG